jgi:hypothetical protein
MHQAHDDAQLCILGAANGLGLAGVRQLRTLLVRRPNPSHCYKTIGLWTAGAKMGSVANVDHLPTTAEIEAWPDFTADDPMRVLVSACLLGVPAAWMALLMVRHTRISNGCWDCPMSAS